MLQNGFKVRGVGFRASSLKGEWEKWLEYLFQKTWAGLRLSGSQSASRLDNPSNPDPGRCARLCKEELRSLQI